MSLKQLPLETRDQKIRVRKKRIAYLFNHSYFLGGGEISFFELIRGINKDRIDPIIVVPAAGKVSEKLKLLGVQVIVCPFAPLKLLGLGRALIHLLNLVNILKKHRIDLIHANGSRVCLYAGLAGRILGVPVLWHVREALCDRYLYDGLLGCLASAILCVSNSARIKRFNRYNETINRKISVVHNGIDTGQFRIDSLNREAARKKNGLHPNQIVFGSVGNIISRKRQDFFIRGLANACRLQPAIPLKGFIIGHQPDAEYREKLFALIKELKLNDNVIFCDYSPAIMEIYPALDVFVLSSSSEGLSRALLEAMSCGLPVIASKIAETVEAVADPANGILVDLDDVDKMAAAILQFATDDRLRRSVGRTSRTLVKRRFGLSSHADDIESIYHRLTNDRDEILHGRAAA